MAGGRRFVKGQSGNPSGRPKSIFNSRAAFEAEVLPTVARLVDLRDNSPVDSVRLGACREILDRAVGKAMQALEMAGEAGGAIRVDAARDPVDLARDIAFILAQANAATAAE